MSSPQGTPPVAPCRIDIGDLLILQRSGLFARDWFLKRNTDLDEAGLDPLVHYFRYGWREGRWPNPYFDPAWYLRRNRDVRNSGAEPLLHYIEHGEAEGRQPVAWFEPEWYRATHGIPAGQLCLAHFLQHRHGGLVSPIPEFDAQHYLLRSPDVRAARMDPFEHYLLQGAKEDREAAPGFDGRFYRERYLRDLPDANPLLHYRAHRFEPGVFPTRPASAPDIPSEVRRNTQPGPLFEEVQPLAPGAPRRAKVLAFYLPQFHPMPENDAWWGRGFTEWTNVARGLPRFAGHYQPRIPRDLGHYRLHGTDTLRQQAELARGAGVHGFVFYFYWFNGRRLLHAPLDALLADPTVDLPFCLMWANENWSRRWDGSEHEVLISQDYHRADEPALVAELLRHFRDARYIRLGGRPVLMVYRAGLIPGCAAAVDRWRALFRAHGEDPVFVMAQSFDDRDPRPHGMDAAVEFPPHKLTNSLQPLNGTLRMLDHAATARVYSYEDAAAAADLSAPPYPLIRTALPSWDNDARRQGAGMVLHGSTPAAYQAWLDRLITAAAAQPVGGEAVVCVNAWNEWAEGAYLEPDTHFGAAYLNATGRAVAGVAAEAGRRRLLLVGHDAWPSGAQMLLLHLGRHLRQVRGIEVAFLLGGGGALEAEYRSVGPVTILAGAPDLPRQAQAAAARGYGRAIVNTSAAAHACEALAQAGIACTMLVHELPRLLRERGLVDGARSGAAVAEHVVFASPYVRDRFHELVAVPPGRAAVLPQGLYRPVSVAPEAAATMRARLGLPEGALLAVGLGYADLRKGFDLFLQAWRLARAADPGIHLLWVGDIDPHMLAYLGAEIAAAEMAGTFHHIPHCADGADWLACADVFLLTSREDPFPSVVLEAMSAGVPCVAFEESGGTPDLLREFGAGVAVPLGDAAEMVRQMRALALQTRSGDRERLAQTARRCFGWDGYADRLLRLADPGTPEISVVVPNYNYARYLEGRLGSVFAQTHPVSEVIVLDDASTDSSWAVVRDAAAAAGRSVRWLAGASNSGSVFKQWRRAADLARSEWLWIAEADDGADPGFLAALCRALADAPDAVLAFSDSRAVDAGGGTMWPDHQGYYAEAEAPMLARDGVFPAGEFLRGCLGARNLILNASAVVWRRAALQGALRRCGADLAEFAMAGDWRIYAEALSEGGSVAYVSRPLNAHRRHAASVTHRLPVARHLDEVARMHRHMQSVLGADPELVRRQCRAMAEARAALRQAAAPFPSDDALRPPVDNPPCLAEAALDAAGG